LDEASLAGGDIFDVLWQTTEVKMRVALRYPLENRFYQRALTDTSLPADIRSELDATVGTAFTAMEQITAGVDERLLKEGLDKEMVGNIIYLVCSGMAREILAELDPNANAEYWQEQMSRLKACFDFMRRLFYQNHNSI
jgi:hypothetical protein